MGSKRLHLTEKHTHLRMRDRGYTAKQIAEATGNSRASIYRSFNIVDNGYPLMPVLVGRPRKLNNDDIDFIEDYLARTSDPYASELVQGLHDVRGVSVEESTVLR